MRRALWLSIGGALLLHGQSKTVFQTETRLVVVDAVVTDKKGERIRDLAKKDFHVWEDNKEQALRTFAFEINPAAAEPQRLILFFDNHSLKPADQVRARNAAASFIDAHASSSSPMAVLDYDGSLRVTQNFTDNPGRLKDAVNGSRYGGITAGNTPAVNNTSLNTTSLNTTAASTASNTGGADLSARGLMGVMASLARNLSAVPGRKIIVVLSAGVPVSSDASHDVDAAVQACNRSNTGVYAIDLGDPMSLAGASTLDISQSDSQPSRFPARGMGSTAARGAQPARTEDQVDTRALAALAQGSGGFVVHDANDLLRGLQEIGKEQNGYYALGYTPPESKEGSCHNLRVKVDRGGVTVRARSSYCSTKAQDLLAGSAAAKDLETRAAAAKSGNVSASMQLPFFYAGPNVARVRVAMEIVPDALKFETQKGKLHAELNVLGIASTADGDIAARFSDVVKLDVEDKRAPVRYEKEFKIAPGQYKFTVVFSSGGASFGKLEAPLVIEPYDRTTFSVSGLALSKEVRPVSDLGLNAGLFEDTTALIADGVQVVPAGSNQFRKGDLALLYCEIYDLAAGNVQVRMRVLDRKTGEERVDTGLLRIGRAKTGVTIPVGTRLPVTGLAPGAYTLELAAVEEDGRQFKRAADFEIR